MIFSLSCLDWIWSESSFLHNLCGVVIMQMIWARRWYFILGCVFVWVVCLYSSHTHTYRVSGYLLIIFFKVEKILKGSLDSIPSPSPSVKIQIMGGKVCLRCKDKTLLFVFKSLLTTPSNVLPLHLKQISPHIIWIFTEGEGDGIESKLLFKIFSTLRIKTD